MAYEIPVFCHTFVAASIIAQYTFVKLDAAGKIVPCAATTDVPIGIAQDPGAVGDNVNVMMLGISKVQAAEVIAIGNVIGCAADARADVKVVGTETTQYATGRALEAASAAGAIIAVTVNTLVPSRAA